MPYPRRIEGYAIVTEDGMLANASGIMPDQLKFEADQRFFKRGLDGVDVVVHGRHSHERQRRSDLRLRLILVRYTKSAKSARAGLDATRTDALMPQSETDIINCVRLLYYGRLPPGAYIQLTQV